MFFFSQKEKMQNYKYIYKDGHQHSDRKFRVHYSINIMYRIVGLSAVST